MKPKIGALRPFSFFSDRFFFSFFFSLFISVSQQQHSTATIHRQQSHI